MYKLYHELPNNLRLRILGNKGISGKPKQWVRHSLVSGLPLIKKFVITLKNWAKLATELCIKLYISQILKFVSKHFVGDCLKK